jgi:CRP/FNR family transcriptional regulator
MMNLQVELSPSRLPASLMAPAMKREHDERWLSMREVMDLLQFHPLDDAINGEYRFAHRRIKAGQCALHTGQPFDGLYVVRFGALKTSITYASGDEHVIAFPMKGDLLGFDGICENQYLSDVVALKDCDLVRIPAAAFFTPNRACNEIERMAYWAMSREIVHEQTAYSLSHQAKSEARVARFLRIQSERFAAMGYSPNRFALPMSRRDIGNYLSITMETVSRAFSVLDELGVISVIRREIQIHSQDALREIEG